VLRLSLQTEPDNAAALALYRQYGFAINADLATLSLTLDHLHSQPAAADTALPSHVLDAIDAIVAPGLDLAPDEKIDTPPSLQDVTLRRRRS
jgi:hypothetical protein